jgi:phage tail-like protein
MSARFPFVYRFASPAQWDACLFSGLERVAGDSGVVLEPLLPYGPAEPLQRSNGAFAPACSRVGELIWRDAAGCLHRWSDCDDGARALAAPLALGGALRIVRCGDALWCLGRVPATLECFDADSLSRRLVVSVPVERLLDLAWDGASGLYALGVNAAAHAVCLHVDCTGCASVPIPLPSVCSPSQIAYARDADMLAFLTEGGAGLTGVANGQSAASFYVRFGAFRPCFTASVLASDGRSRFLVGGKDGSDFGGEPALLVIAADGTLESVLPLPAPPTGIAAAAAELFVTYAAGILRCTSTRIVPEGGYIEGALITPLLHSPPGLAERPWLRAELLLSLPAGVAAEISYACLGSADTGTRAQAAAIVSDRKKISSQKFDDLQALLSWSVPTVLSGSDALATLAPLSSPVSSPLSDAAAEYLWLRVRLIASPGASVPSLAALSVLYPERSLLDDLPAAYRRNAAAPASYLRALLGVLESTTQNLDARIAALGALIAPATGQGAWTDLVAGWLGLPWDGALEPAQKHRLLIAAAELGRARGTRAGLETLMQCLFPGTPRRYRIVDVGVDFGLLTLGGASCRGTGLPAVLAGLPVSAAVLSRKAILGKARLPCGTASDDGRSRFANRLRVDLAATTAQRKAWEPWLTGVLAAVVPASARVQIRWLSPAALPGDEWLTDSSTLRPAPATRLGSEAFTGLTVLPYRRDGMSLQ